VTDAEERGERLLERLDGGPADEDAAVDDRVDRSSDLAAQRLDAAQEVQERNRQGASQ
jgi:hypothetical protein